MTLLVTVNDVSSALREAGALAVIVLVLIVVVAPIAWWVFVGRERADRNAYERDVSARLAEDCREYAAYYRAKARAHRDRGETGLADKCENLATAQERRAERHERFARR